MNSGKLAEYRRKRRPQRSGEPTGRPHDRRDSGGGLFVIQKHDASNLHYDLRLEVDGVLKSWAVPKGPSTDPRDKRLAIATDDHPLDYADFEGTIPAAEYGGGTVLIWDRGDYRNRKADTAGMQACYDDGLIEFDLDGHKLAGGYALTLFRKKQGQWLLIKMDDGDADARRNPVSTQRRSVASGRTLQQIRREANNGR